MRSTAILFLSALAALSAAQEDLSIQDLPACATNCFLSAVATSDCGLTDSACQCTTGRQAIQLSAIACLCKSECTATELMKAQAVSNGICTAALEAVGQEFDAQTVGPAACQAQGGSASGATTTTAGGSSGSGASESASATTSQSVEVQSDNAAAPAFTGLAKPEGAILGLVGAGLMAL